MISKIKKNCYDNFCKITKLCVFFITIALIVLLWDYITISDIISILGLGITILAYLKAASANESAQLAAKATEKQAERYTNNLLLHTCQRLVDIMNTMISIKNKKLQYNVCMYIRHELYDIRNSIVSLSYDQQIFFQDFITFLTDYTKRTNEEKMKNYIAGFCDLISDLTHIKEQNNG